MDGETVRATIAGICTVVATIGAAVIASRTTIISAQIALRQLEMKEKLESKEHEKEEAEREAEIELLKQEIESLKKQRLGRKRGRNER